MTIIIMLLGKTCMFEILTAEMCEDVISLLYNFVKYFFFDIITVNYSMLLTPNILGVLQW